MDLKTYIADLPRKRSLALALNTHPDYLWQLANAWKGRRPSPRMAERIEAATCGVVTKEESIFGQRKRVA